MSDEKSDDHELSVEELKAIEEKYDEAAATRPVTDRMHNMSCARSQSPSPLTSS